MNLKERIGEINKKLFDCGYTFGSKMAVPQEEIYSVSQATTDILKAIRESLPEKKKIVGGDVVLDDLYYKTGYNQVIEDMKERLL